MEYQIEKQTWYDEYGVSKDINYKIYYFVNKWYWYKPIKKYITHRECYTSGCYNVRTNFKTEDEAKQFIKNIACPNKPKNRWVNELTTKLNKL